MIFETEIKAANWLLLGTKKNMIKVGKILWGIRENKLYLDKYQNFGEFLDSDELWCSRRHAYNFLSIYEQFGSLLDGNAVQKLHKLGIQTLLDIARVKDKEVREDLISEATKTPPQAIARFKEKVNRFQQRTDNDLETPLDSHLDKTIRTLNTVIEQVDSVKATLGIVKLNVEKAVNMAFKHDNIEVFGLKESLLERWKEIVP